MKKGFLKKILSCVLLASMVISLAACGSKKEDVKEESETEAVEESEAEESEEAPAEEEREHVTLKIVTRTNSDQPGGQEMAAALNEYLEEKYNTTLEWTIILGSEWGTQITPILAGEWDIIQGVGTTTFTTNALRNAFLPLDDYIDEYLPGAKATLPAEAWDVYTVGGHCYAVAPYKDLAERWVANVNATLIEETGVEFPEDEYWTFFDVLPWLKELKDKRDELHPEYKDVPICGDNTYLNSWFYYDPLVGSYSSTLACTNIPGLPGFDSIADENTVFCPFYTEEYVEMALAIQDMVSNGYLPGDKEYDKDKTLMQKGILAGDFPVGTIETDPDKNAPYYTTAMYPAKGAYIATTAIQVGGQVVNANCKYPERALEIIDLFFTDEYVSTVAHFGVEGKDWTDVDNDGVVELGERNSDPAARYWYQWYGWWIGSLTATKYAEGQTPQFGERLAELNDSATISPNMGFVADTSNIENEVAACKNVISEFHGQIARPLGLSAEQSKQLCADFAAKLKANGMDTIIAEIQSQLDAWKAAQ